MLGGGGVTWRVVELGWGRVRGRGQQRCARRVGGARLALRGGSESSTDEMSWMETRWPGLPD
eukprot:4638254-Prymnesium_polylepis.1